MVDSIHQGQVNVHLLIDWAPLDVRQCGEQGIQHKWVSHCPECHSYFHIVNHREKTLRAANVIMVTFVRKLTVELRTPIKNTEKKNGIYTL